MNLKEGGVLAEEVIDVKEKKKKKNLSPALWPLSKKKKLTERKSQFFIY